MKLSRELRDLVWSMPMTEIARRSGVRDQQIGRLVTARRWHALSLAIGRRSSTENARPVIFHGMMTSV
jgi:hypothetical protein